MARLSIITVNLNNSKGLQRTMDSVFQQTFTDYEYIIIDGGSTDGSKELIKKHANKLVYWLSEKDKGIYNAMNKGVHRATGAYLLFLNSGDELKDAGVLEEMVPFLDGTDIVYGNINLVESASKSWIGHYPDHLSFDNFITGSLPHAGSFIKRDLFIKPGLYDESLQICSDWKFFLNAICAHGASYRHTDRVVSTFYLNGISSVQGSDELIHVEKRRVIASEYPSQLARFDELTERQKELSKSNGSWPFRVRSQLSQIRKRLFEKSGS